MSLDLETRIREALLKAISVPDVLSPATKEAIASYLVTGNFGDVEYLEAKAWGTAKNLPQTVDRLVWYAKHEYFFAMGDALTTLERILRDHHES